MMKQRFDIYNHFRSYIDCRNDIASLESQPEEIKAQKNKQSSLREYKHPAEFQEFLSFKTQWNVNDTLPRPEYRQGTATVTGKIFGLPETANCKIIVSPRGVLDGDEKEFETKVNPDGSFQITVPLTQSVSPAMIEARGAGMIGFTADILLADGEKEPCGVFFDEGFYEYNFQKANDEGKQLEFWTLPKPVVFCGPYSDINNAMYIGECRQITRRFSNEEGLGYDEDYQKAYIEFIEKQIEMMKMQPISPRAKDILALRLRTEITAELVQNCMKLESGQKKKIWRPRSIYRYLKDEKYFPTENNRMMLSSHLSDYGRILYYGFSSDSINLKLYGENLDKNADIEDVQHEAKIWQDECFGGENTVFCDAIIAYQCNEMLKQQMPFDSASVAFLKDYREPVVGEIFLTMNEENIVRKERTKGLLNAINLPDFGDRIIDKIKELHAGRYIYIDIWATWCGPCRKAIAEMKPLKPEFKAQNVDFVYLTDESSPLEAWQNQILDIDGEHFRITKQQMEAVFRKFGFKGWPSYLIISPKGEILYQSSDAYLHDMPKTLQEAIEKILAE